MTVLANFPLISQNTPISADGSSPNQSMDCVPTAILAGLMYLNGITALSKDWNPDKLLDMAYPEGYKGGTSAAAFVKACATLGCTLAPIDGPPEMLVQAMHAQVAQGHPCIVTVPDVYVPASYGWTHVLCAYGETPDYLTMLDPWPGKPTTRSDAEWATLLLDNQIWVLSKNAPPVVEELMTIDLTNPTVAQYFELANTDGSQWRSRVDVTGAGKYPIIQDGILNFYKQFGGNALCGLTYLGLPLSYEVPLPGGVDGATIQYFERANLIYDPAHKNDTPPAAGSVYVAHQYNGVAQDPRLVPLQAQVTALQTQLTEAQAASSNVALQQELDAANAKLAQVEAQVKAIGQSLVTLV